MTITREQLIASMADMVAIEAYLNKPSKPSLMIGYDECIPIKKEDIALMVDSVRKTKNIIMAMLSADIANDWR